MVFKQKKNRKELQAQLHPFIEEIRKVMKSDSSRNEYLKNEKQKTYKTHIE